MNERLCIGEVGVNLELCVHAHGPNVDLIMEASCDIIIPLLLVLTVSMFGHAPPSPPCRYAAAGWSLPQPLPLSLLDQGVGDVTGLYVC